MVTTMAMVKKARIVKSPLSSCDRSYAFAHALDVAPRQQQKRNGPRPTPPPFISVRESPFRRRLRLSSDLHQASLIDPPEREEEELPEMQAESNVENTAPANFARPLRYPNVVVV